MAVESFKPESTTPRLRGGKRSVLVFEELRREIVLGLAPPHASLRELELAERFACSQSTVREALLLLQEEGLVVRAPHRGTSVADCRMEDMVELLRLRHDIECRGAERVMERYGRLARSDLMDLIDRMMAAAKADDEYALSQLDSRFHLRIYEEADLPSVQPVLQRCLVHNHRYKILNTEHRLPLTQTAERHVQIIDALDSGDSQRAVAALSHHIATIVDIGPSILPREGGEAGA